MSYIDLHCDTISRLLQENKKLQDGDCQVSIEKLKAGDCLLQCFAMFLNLKKEKEPFKKCIEMIDRYYEELAQNSNDIAAVFTLEDLKRNQKEKRISALLTLEEGGILEGKLSYLRMLYRLGVRMICLNWNYKNGVGHPNFKLCSAPDFHTPDTQNGLTSFGIEVVKEMNRLGIIIDVSHLSDKGFYDCISLSTKPIVASHSNARAVCSHVRNLTDDMILALARNGGVMGLNFCHAFLDDDEEIGKQTIPCLLRHIKHIQNLVGIDYIAIGSDFDGIDPNITLKDASLIPELFLAMRKEGFTEEDIKKVSYLNFLRVFERNLG